MAEDHDEKDVVDLFVQRASDASSKSGILGFVKFIALLGLDCPELQHALCSSLLAGGTGSDLGDDQWSILEVAAQAAVAVGALPAAQQYLTALSSRFPGSNRVQRLALLLKEGQAAAGARASRLGNDGNSGNGAKDSDDSSDESRPQSAVSLDRAYLEARVAAVAGYKRLLEGQDSDVGSIKRLIALQKVPSMRHAGAQGVEDDIHALSTALSSLSSYLEGLGQGDTGAWLDGAETHLELGRLEGSRPGAGGSNSAAGTAVSRLSSASFCMEELVLLQPTNAAYHGRLAELLAGHGYGSGSSGSDSTGAQEAAERRMRSSRLHASEAVRLTGKASPYALVALADACYGHYQAAHGRAIGGLALPCVPAKVLPGALQAVEDGAGKRPALHSLGSNSSTSSGGHVLKGEAVEAALGEDRALHALALRLLAGIRDGQAGDKLRRQAKSSITACGVTVTLASVFPALALEAALLSPGTAQVLARQAADMA